MKLRLLMAVGIALSLMITGLLGGPARTSAFESPLPGALANDNFLNATALAGSYSGSFDDSSATIESGEPTGCFSGYFMPHTAWYKFTAPAGGVALIKVHGVPDNFLNVYRARAAMPTGFADLDQVQILCVSYGYPWNDPVRLTVESGQVYYLQVGDLSGSQSGMIYFSLDFQAAPSNDNFAGATEISGLPFSVSISNRAASLQSGEPAPGCGTLYRSVWYRYTATEAQSVMLRTTDYQSIMGVYQGSALETLTAIGCQRDYWSSALVFRTEPGKTYYLQLGDMGYYGFPTVGFSLQVTPPLTANFHYYPGDPTIFDSITFYDYSSDPANQQWQLMSWAFGDGTTATGSTASHRFAEDGAYTVEHSATTIDGRTGSVTQVVQVQTHDVAITRLQAPNSAVAGQTKQLVISVSSKRYDETVQLTLYKSVPGGLTQVGQYAQYVPVRPPGGKATEFTFNYTFTPDDATVAKVTFKAVATIVNVRDALPADNEAVAPPTKVAR